MFPPATGITTARRNLISHLVFLARNRSTIDSGADPLTSPYGVGDAFLDALHHIEGILDPSVPTVEVGSAEAVERTLVRLQGLWTEIVIGETDPVRADEACNYAHKLLARGDDPLQVLEALSHGLTNKLLHAPTHALNQAEGDERSELAQLLARIYHLHPGE